MKRTWTFCGILAMSAVLAACGKGGSQNAAQDAASSASAPLAQSGADASGVAAASGATGQGGVGVITKAQLPAEAAETLRLISKGGPYPFSEDGVLFRNSAGLLPQHPRGYYRAYTVRTPGAADRGQRRIICGGARKQTTECYYTDDYYVSLKRITG